MSRDEQALAKAGQLTERLYAYPNKRDRYQYLEGIIEQTRPDRTHIDCWRAAVHNYLIDTYVDITTDNKVSYTRSQTEPLAYLYTFQALLRGFIQIE